MFSSIACSKADSVALFLYRWRHRRHSLYRLMFVSEFFILHFLGWFSSPWTIGHSPCSSIYMLFFHTLPVKTRTGTVGHIRRIVKLPEALLCVPLLGFFKGKLKDKHVKISAPYLSGTCTSFIICNGTSVEVEGTFLSFPASDVEFGELSELNCLPVHIRQTSSLPCFNPLLKTHLFEDAYL